MSIPGEFRSLEEFAATKPSIEELLEFLPKNEPCLRCNALRSQHHRVDGLGLVCPVAAMTYEAPR
jgi:hypothetical protein